MRNHLLCVQHTYCDGSLDLNATRPTETTAEVAKKLQADGWVKRGGKGDHVNFFKPGIRHIITLDMGRREIAFGILHRIYKLAGWRW